MTTACEISIWTGRVLAATTHEAVVGGNQGRGTPANYLNTRSIWFVRFVMCESFLRTRVQRASRDAGGGLAIQW